MNMAWTVIACRLGQMTRVLTSKENASKAARAPSESDISSPPGAGPSPRQPLGVAEPARLLQRLVPVGC